MYQYIFSSVITLVNLFILLLTYSIALASKQFGSSYVVSKSYRYTGPHYAHSYTTLIDIAIAI